MDLCCFLSFLVWQFLSFQPLPRNCESVRTFTSDCCWQSGQLNCLGRACLVRNSMDIMDWSWHQHHQLDFRVSILINLILYILKMAWLRRARAIESTWFRSKHLRWFRWINMISGWQTSVIHVRNIQSMVGFIPMHLFCCIRDVFDIFDILRCCSWPVEKPWPCAKKGGRRWKHPRLAHPSHSGTRSITPGPEVKS